MRSIINPQIILWIYIVLLVVGGLVGFLKAGSRISLNMSLAFAVALSLCAMGVLNITHLADVLMLALLIVFGMRFAKTKKFVPGGLMAVVTIVALALRYLL